MGLVLSYALSLTGLLSGLVSSFTQTEAMMVSVERLEEYSCNIPQEPHGQPPQVRTYRPGSELPAMGRPPVLPGPSLWLLAVFFLCPFSSPPRPRFLCLCSQTFLTHLPLSPQSSHLHFSFTPFPQSPHQRVSWLTQGSVEFQDVVLVYRPGLPNALDGVTFRVEPGEKLGIVGRTGSGKSSLFLVLFRLLEPSAGRVLLDGVDTSQLELAELRSGGQEIWGEGEGSPLGRCKAARANG